MENKTVEAMKSYFGLEDRVAIITGGAYGIGEATAFMLSNFGAKLALLDIDERQVQYVATSICDQGGVAIAVPCDVTDENAVAFAVKKTMDTYGKIDILVNNAGGGGHGKTLEEMNLTEWDRLIKLNLTSAYILSMAVIPHMKREMRGKICNISSGSGVIGDISDVHYAASKAGMIGMTKEMAWELAPYHINVNALGTGLTDTRMSRASLWEEKVASLRWYRAGTPYDQAAAITFLVSDAADYITGQTLCPNGGAWM